jgi:NADH:ubiquinone oxidoreductase subunit
MPNAKCQMLDNFSLIRRASQFGIMLQTWFCSAKVGEDEFGNRYYRQRRVSDGSREKRWVVYAGEPEASKVPPEWHIWLHHTADAPLSDDGRRPWQKPHQQNLTGTPDAYLPPGHTLERGKRDPATGDYEAWRPE